MSSLHRDSYFSSSYKRRYADAGPRAAPRSAYGARSSALFSAAPLGASRPGSVEVELSQAAQVSSEFRAVRTQEKAQLQELNDRFACFIDRVRQLEQQNRALEAELLVLRRRHGEPSRLRALYEQEARRLRAAVEEARGQRQAALGRRDHLEEALRALQSRCEEEVLGREGAEGRLAEARREAGEAALGRAQAQGRADALLEELAFLKRLHEGEVTELQAQAHYGAQVAVETEAARPDLSGALRDIRAQYERLAARNLQSAEDWFRSKAGALAEAAAHRDDAARSSRDEAGEHRRHLQACVLEIDACRGLNQALEKQLQETEDKQSAEIAALQDTIGEMESELRATKSEMARYLREYQDLLNVKMALDIEIAAYRKLLEGEETRLSVGMAGGVSSVYSHSMSVAPSFSRSTFAGLGSGAPYMLSSRLLSSSFSTEEVISASHAQQAEASPAQEEEEKEEEEEEKEEKEEKEEEEEEEKEEKEEKEEEEAQEGEEGGDEEGEEGEKEVEADEEGDKKGEEEAEGEKEGEGEEEGEKEGEVEVAEEGDKEGEAQDEGKEEGEEEEGAKDEGGEEAAEEVGEEEAGEEEKVKKGEVEEEEGKGEEEKEGKSSEADTKGGEEKGKEKEVEQPKGKQEEEKKKEDKKEKPKEKKKE